MCRSWKFMRLWLRYNIYIYSVQYTAIISVGASEDSLVFAYTHLPVRYNSLVCLIILKLALPILKLTTNLMTFIHVFVKPNLAYTVKYIALHSKYTAHVYRTYSCGAKLRNSSEIAL